MNARQTRDDKQTRTLKRLVKKLSALRHTLSKSEREMLDTLILGAPAEVTGHMAPRLRRPRLRQPCRPRFRQRLIAK